jgi:2-oxoisovalerate dehydrogenase E1 component beta subunit
VPINFASAPILHHTSRACLADRELPASAKASGTKPMTLCQAVNDALATALARDERVLLFGEDVAFGGVFRCSADLARRFGSGRVFNTPLSEQSIVGFAIGCAAEGLRPVAEIQFADYVFPAFDQLVNEAAKFRYRAGSTGRHVGGLVVRMPCGAVGHGGM